MADVPRPAAVLDVLSRAAQAALVDDSPLGPEDAALLRELADALAMFVDDEWGWCCFATGRGYSNCGGECASCRLARLLGEGGTE